MSCKNENHELTILVDVDTMAFPGCLLTSTVSAQSIVDDPVCAHSYDDSLLPIALGRPVQQISNRPAPAGCLATELAICDQIV